MDPETELEQLRARVDQLEQHLHRLLGERPAPSAASPDSGDPATEGFSRRRMLRNGLGMSAAAVAGVGMLDAVGSSAAATNGDAVTIAGTASPTTAASAPTRILNPSTTTHSAVLFQVDNTTDDTVAVPANTSAAIIATFAGHDSSPTNQSAILGLSELGIGVDGRSTDYRAVSGSSSFGVGVYGNGGVGTGVQAVSTSGPGVDATSTSGRGVTAASTDGEGVHATSATNIGVVGYGPFGIVGNGTTTGGAPGGTGVGATGNTGVIAVGVTTGVDATSHSGVAVQATSTDGTAVKATSGSGPAVVAVSTDDTGLSGATSSASNPAVLGSNSSGTGVAGTSAGGLGGSFQGARAAVRLVPQGRAGQPTAGDHQRGELIVDARGRLWLCTKAGNPGAWRKVALA